MNGSSSSSTKNFNSSTHSSSSSSLDDYDTRWPQFNPFVRHPTSRLGVFLTICTGSILVPIRLVGALITLSLGWVWAKIALIGLPEESKKDPSAQPYSPLRHKIISIGFRILSRLLLFFFGYLWIHNVQIKDHDGKAKKKKGDEDSTVIPTPKAVVCNHTGFVELLYLAYKHGCSFVSKEENKHLPFMGPISKSLQCIFVERSNREGTNNTSRRIQERLEAEPGVWPLLAIAPEGTTTNGFSLIHFHTGAFRPGQPVLPIAIEMPFSPTWGYDPSFSCTNMGLHIFGLMAQPMNRMTAYELPVYAPTEEEKKNSTMFANNVRQRIADTLNIPIYPKLQWRDKLLYEPSKKGRDLGAKLLAEKNGGTLPPFPKFTQDVFGNSLTGVEAKYHEKKE